MTRLIALAFTMLCAVAGVAVADGQSPPESTATPSQPVLDLAIPDLATDTGAESIVTISWNPIDGASNYLLGGALHATRENATDPCGIAPVEPDTRETALDARIEAPRVTYTIVLPALPSEERWRIVPEQMTLRAFDQAGIQIAGVMRGAVVESCAFEQAQQPPVTSLPETGMRWVSSTWPGAVSASIAAAAIGIVLMAVGLRLNRSTLWR